MAYIHPILARASLRTAFSSPTPCLARSFASKSVKSSLPPKSFLLQAFRRPASTFAVPSIPPVAYSREWWTRIAGTVGVVAAGTVAINFALNRETRDPLRPFEKEYLHSSFRYLGGGLVIVSGLAVLLHKNGISSRLMRLNPWVFMGVSAVGGIGSMMGVMYTDPANQVQKSLSFLGFQAFQALTLSPLLFLNPVLLARAGLYTAGIIGSLSWIGATAQSETFLYMGGPLMCGLVVVALSSLAPLVLPATAIGTLALTQSLSLYGGLAVFSGFTLYDTQKILAHARACEQGMMKPDPMRESVSLELDFINIFVVSGIAWLLNKPCAATNVLGDQRMVQILAMQQGRRK